MQHSCMVQARVAGLCLNIYPEVPSSSYVSYFHRLIPFCRACTFLLPLVIVVVSPS